MEFKQKPKGGNALGPLDQCKPDALLNLCVPLADPFGVLSITRKTAIARVIVNNAVCKKGR